MSNPPPARFSGMARLVSGEGLTRLQRARVAVIGVGGVGSWTVEALARSGVGALTFMDLDEVCVSNVNRQIHALDDTVGKAKVEVLRDRVQKINPDCRIDARFEFLTEANADAVMDEGFDYIVDALDAPHIKCLLIGGCKKRGLPLVTVGGAGGRIDPTQVQQADLSRSMDDPLLMKVRKVLRRHYGFPRNPRKKFGIPCVFSREAIRYPQADGSVSCRRDPGNPLRLDCSSGYGTAAFVTGAFGFAAASRVVEDLSREPST